MTTQDLLSSSGCVDHRRRHTPENPFPMAFSEGEWPPLFDDQVQLTLWRLRQQP